MLRHTTDLSNQFSVTEKKWYWEAQKWRWEDSFGVWLQYTRQTYSILLDTEIFCLMLLLPPACSWSQNARLSWQTSSSFCSLLVLFPIVFPILSTTMYLEHEYDWKWRQADRQLDNLIVYSQSEGGNYFRFPFQILIIKLNTGDYKTTSKYPIMDYLRWLWFSNAVISHNKYERLNRSFLFINWRMHLKR